MTVGSFTSPGLSAPFQPYTANAPFFVTMGPGSGFAYLTMASVSNPAQSDFALQFGADGNPVTITGPGAVQIYPPPSALPYGIGGTVAPTFQLACKVLAPGTTSWAYQFTQP